MKDFIIALIIALAITIIQIIFFLYVLYRYMLLVGG